MLTGLELALPQCYISRSSILLTGYAVGVGSAKKSGQHMYHKSGQLHKGQSGQVYSWHKKNTLPNW